MGSLKNTKKIVPKKEKEFTEDDIMKYEIAEELGLLNKVQSTGWKSLTAKESGKIGGIMTKRKREKLKDSLTRS